MQPESKENVCLQYCDDSTANRGEVFILNMVGSDTMPSNDVMVISDEEDTENKSLNEKKVHSVKLGSLNQKELCKDLNELLLNATFYVMSSHKILEAERVRLVRGRRSCEKQFQYSQRMRQESDDLLCTSNPSFASDVILSHVDPTVPSRISKDCETEVLLSSNFASGSTEGILEKDRTADWITERCEGNTVNRLDITPKNSPDKNIIYHKGTKDFQHILTSQDQVIKEIKEEKSVINMCTDESMFKFCMKPESCWESLLVQPKLLTGAEMKPFQIEGYLWLKRLYLSGINGILADEMGLGKTIQCVALICDLIENDSAGPYLICSPLSTVPHWVQSFTRFAPKVPILTYVGDQSERSRLRSLIYKKQICGSKSILPVILTSYEIAMKDVRYLGLASFSLLILDEGHRIKNSNCKLLQSLINYGISHRFLLTGTPLQNNVRELFTLLKFILPELFSHIPSLENWLNDKFLKTVDDSELLTLEEEQKETLSILHQILTPFMLRRLKVDVELMIPPKEEIIIYTELTPCQKSLYRTLLEKFRNMSSRNMCTDADKICCPSRLRPRPASLSMEKNQADVASKTDSVTNSQKILKMINVNRSCGSLFLNSDDDCCNEPKSFEGKEFASNEDISHIRVSGKKRKVLCQNLEPLDVIHSGNLVKQGDHSGIIKQKQDNLLSCSHSSSDVTSCKDSRITTSDDSVRSLQSGGSYRQQLRTRTDYNQNMKRCRSRVVQRLLDRSQSSICSTASKASEDYQGADFSDCSAENSNMSCNIPAGSVSCKGFVFDRKSHSSCESGRGTLETEDRMEDVDLLSESWDHFNSISDESEDEEIEFTKSQLHNSLVLLRQCCSHPYIIERPVRNNEIVVDERLVTSSGKMIMLDRLLVQLKKDGHKVLIFCQMLEVLDFLEDYCEMRNYSYCRLDGKMSLEDRKTEISKFSSDDGVFLFLLSTRAGGYGLTLTKADTVVIYESDMNPQCDIQAQDRCHRIGQENPVKVFRLLSANTVDQLMFEKALAKKKLEQLVIHRGKFKTGIARYRPLGRDELETMLKDEEVRSLQASRNNGSLEISEEDLQHLIDRSELYEKWQRNQHDALHAAKSERGSCTSKDIFTDIRKCAESLYSSEKVSESQEIIHLEDSDSLDVISTNAIESQEIIDLENSDVELIEMINSDIEIIED